MDDYVVVYLDDRLVFSEDKDKHLEYLEEVLIRLRPHELYVGKSKCSFMEKGTTYLGLVNIAKGIKIGTGKKQPIKNWQKPKKSK